MKHLFKTLITSGLIVPALLVGCNQTTQKDVTAKREKVANEERKLAEAQREEARTANKPVIDQPTQNGRDMEQAHDKVARQAERVQEAKKEERNTQRELANEQQRDQFLIDCKTSIDLANRAIEKLQTKRNAATEEQKADIDRQINDMKSKRDAVQTEINNIRTANKDRWMDYKAAAQQAMDDLNRESGKVS